MILVIEDDAMINGLICKVLKDHGYETESALDGAGGERMALEKDYELILLDLMLPGKTGEEILTDVRKVKSTPTIILSAKNEVYNRIELLRLGADDYVCKPSVMEYKNLRLEKDSKRVFIGDNEISCTAMEYGILELMLANPNKVFSKRNLFESLTGEEYLSEDNTMNVHVSNLRKKIAKYTEEPYLDTVYGMGYRLSK